VRTEDEQYVNRQLSHQNIGQERQSVSGHRDRQSSEHGSRNSSQQSQGPSQAGSERSEQPADSEHRSSHHSHRSQDPASRRASPSVSQNTRNQPNLDVLNFEQQAAYLEFLTTEQRGAYVRAQFQRGSISSELRDQLIDRIEHLRAQATEDSRRMPHQPPAVHQDQFRDLLTSLRPP